MRSRAPFLAILATLAAVLAACAPLPSLPAPAATPVTAAPVETSVTSPLPTPEPAVTAVAPITPTLSAPIAPAVEMTPTAEVVPAIVGTPIVTGTTAVSPTMTNGRPLESAPTAGMTTYSDKIGGFEMDYPATWSVVDVAPEIKQQSLSYSVTFMSWAPEEPGGEGIPEGGSKIDLSVTKGGAASPEAATESRRQELTAQAGTQITFEEPWDLPGGLAATHWIVQPSTGQAVHELVTAINGNRIVVSGLGEATVFERSASTLRSLAALAEGSAVTMSETAPTSEASGAQEQQRVVAPMVSSEGASAGAQPLAGTVYTVRRGDTLAKIAARFGVSVSAILRANPQITNADRIYVGQRVTIPSSGSDQPPPATTRVDIFMIGIGGGSVGCGDQVVAVRRDVPKTAAPLTAALNLLLAQKSQYYGESGLYNALYQSDLRIAGITRSGTDWTIHLTGTVRLGGVCDNPRVKAQLEQTARQFSTVTSVRYFINGQPLDAVLSEK